MLRFDRKQQNSVKQLSFSNKVNFYKKSQKKKKNRMSICTRWIYIVQRNPGSKLSISLDHRESKGIPEKMSTFCFINYSKAFDCEDHNKFRKIPKERITRSPYLSPQKPGCWTKARVRTGHGTTDWFQIGKRVRQGCILSP